MQNPIQSGHSARSNRSAPSLKWLPGSLALNAALLICLLQREMDGKSRLPDAAPRTSGGVIPAVELETKSAAAQGREAAGPKPPFSWAEVESADYREYVANLRAVGCPEAVIRDIVVADLNQLYGSRVAAIWRPQERAYWQKAEPDAPDAEQIRQLRVLDEEKNALARELLGYTPRTQDLIDTVYLQLHGSEHELLFLPQDRREAALRALQQSGYAAKHERMLVAGPQRDPQRELFAEQLQALAGVLSAAELEEFRLRNAPRAQWLRGEVQYFECTTAEFKALLDRLESRLADQPDHLAVDRMVAIEDARAVFGEDRAREFERVSDSGYLNMRGAMERLGTSPVLADQAGRIAAEARQRAQALAQDPELLAEERRRRVQDVRDQAGAELARVLGERAARIASRNLEMSLSPFTLTARR